MSDPTPPDLPRGGEAQKALVRGLNVAIKQHLDASPTSPTVAAVAVGLMQISLAYFALTKAPKVVVRDFIETLLGPLDDASERS